MIRILLSKKNTSTYAWPVKVVQTPYLGSLQWTVAGRAIGPCGTGTNGIERKRLSLLISFSSSVTLRRKYWLAETVNAPILTMNTVSSVVITSFFLF